MATQRQERVSELLRELAATYLSRESNRTSLITVTGCTVSANLSRATVLFTVLPEDKEADAAEFVTRQMGALREYVKDRTRLRVLPYFDACIDRGEKMRQKIDAIPKSTIE
ncbi:MAG: hypothetical protein A2675_00960 [Candidatus Yonathbacteria bacterium RIFCSPHIGHO2_01_FULL_51_10]|uniref:Ribosome-binding factor A n=1 Tax=Candidatus Yonathbacteria bacterium RIFCSPHIGHO2_01_FULL_51_10 TaxID=1802723 RepID=A0A1G2S8I2_9BACT|nr:MAG: hypothetical protein A2675_00960 [Candidatus Yonathbacteria bacterium RIFCSPHIGHO2_01_FULL_51_10]